MKTLLIKCWWNWHQYMIHYPFNRSKWIKVSNQNTKKKGSLLRTCNKWGDSLVRTTSRKYGKVNRPWNHFTENETRALLWESIWGHVVIVYWIESLPKVVDHPGVSDLCKFSQLCTARPELNTTFVVQDSRHFLFWLKILSLKIKSIVITSILSLKTVCT